MNPLRTPLLLVVSLLLAGCATESHPYRHLTGDPLVDGQSAIEHGPARDKVLWQYRTGLAALRAGQDDLARRYLDDAIARISNIYGKDESASKARGYFAAEAKKTFIGEPYERAMAYFYRGLLYWKEGEPDNARACFRSGQLLDSDTEEKSYSGDYVLFDYLDGYITIKLGGDGSDAMKRAQTEARFWRPPDFSPKANVMVFFDYGPGPKKFATGQYAEQLRFSSGAVLGTTRNREPQIAGLALVGAGLVSKIFSAAAIPEADIRMWDNLPLFVSFVALELPPGQHTLSVEFHDATDHLIPGLTKVVNLNVPAGAGDKVVYVSDKSITPQTL